jgi:hypothetical protein
MRKGSAVEARIAHVVRPRYQAGFQDATLFHLCTEDELGFWKSPMGECTSSMGYCMFENATVTGGKANSHFWKPRLRWDESIEPFAKREREDALNTPRLRMIPSTPTI